MSSIPSSLNAIAVFDILGFRDFMERNEPSRCMKLLSDLRGTTSLALPNNTVGSIFFGDTIALFGTSHRQMYNIMMVVIASSNLLNLAARSGILLRGAVSVGEVSIDASQNCMVGKPFLDAFELEGQQEWMGATVVEGAEIATEEAMSTSPIRECLVRYPAPMKTGPRVERLCIGWTFRMPSAAPIVDAFVGADERHETYRKKVNTLEFFDFERRRPGLGATYGW